MPSLFISCVSNEFGSYRDAMRRDFTRPNLDAKIQEDFIAYGGATLEKLDEYIKHCEAVIHICGDMTGSMANKISVQYIKVKYEDFGQRFPSIEPVLKGDVNLSYTQWEAWLAIYHNKRLFIVAPTEKATRNTKYLMDDHQIKHQHEHLSRLKEQGYYDEIHFDNEDQLVKNLYQSKLGDILNQIPKNKPANLPYQSIGVSFKGREDEVKDLLEFFTNSRNGLKGIAIHGLGGIGKTRLVVEYALARRDHYTALLFVHAGVPELFKTNIANLSAPIILNLPEYVTQDEEIKYAAVVNWLNAYSDWLLILDNADTDAAADKVEALFGSLHHGHVLITTRQDKWSKQINKKPIGVLEPDAAIAFILETTTEGREKRHDDADMARGIAENLGYLALALEQACTYIVTKEISLTTYRRKWESNRTEVLKWFDPRLMQYPASVAITWQTSFNQLSESAMTLLNRLSWMSPDPIPKTVLEIEVPGAEPIDGDNAWHELKQYSLSTSAADKTTFTVHKLVQDVARNRLDNVLAFQTLNEGLSWIDLAFNEDPTEVNNWPKLDLLVPHILSLFEYLTEYEIKNEATRLMSQIAILFFKKAYFSKAESLMRQVLQIDEENYDSSHPEIAIHQNNLASLLMATNRYTEAEQIMREALEVDLKYYGSDHPTVATRLNNLGQLLKGTNHYIEAEQLMREALEIDLKYYGPDHPTVAIYLNNLGQLLRDTNHYNEAEPLMREALEIDLKYYGPDHPTVATRLNNLGQLLKVTNRYEEARPLMLKALEIDEHHFGSSHPLVAIRLNNLASFLQFINQYSEAEPLMLRALEIDNQYYGSRHPTVAIRLSNIAQLLQATNRHNEAEPLMLRALEIDEISFGSHHPNVARDLINLACLFMETERHKAAESLMRKALEIDEISFGPSHPTVAIDLNNLAMLLRVTNRLNEAEPLVWRALEIDEISFGLHHPNVARDLINLASLFMSTKRFIEAEPLVWRALEIDELSLGPNHLDVANDLNNLTILLQATKRYDEAELLMNRSVLIFLKILGFGHPKTQLVIENYYFLLKEMGKKGQEITKIIEKLMEE